MSFNYNKDLNNSLNESYYPHFTNRLFKDLVLPYGLIINHLNNNQNLLNEISIQGEALIKNKFNLESYGDQLSKIINI